MAGLHESLAFVDAWSMSGMVDLYLIVFASSYKNKGGVKCIPLLHL